MKILLELHKNNILDRRINCIFSPKTLCKPDCCHCCHSFMQSSKVLLTSSQLLVLSDEYGIFAFMQKTKAVSIDVFSNKM